MGSIEQLLSANRMIRLAIGVLVMATIANSRSIGLLGGGGGSISTAHAGASSSSGGFGGSSNSFATAGTSTNGGFGGNSNAFASASATSNGGFYSPFNRANRRNPGASSSVYAGTSSGSFRSDFW